MKARFDNDTRFVAGGVIVDWVRCPDGKRARVFARPETIEAWGLNASDRRRVRAEFEVRKAAHLKAAAEAAMRAKGHYVLFELSA